jgi:hypothetical protein
VYRLPVLLTVRECSSPKDSFESSGPMVLKIEGSFHDF